MEELSKTGKVRYVYEFTQSDLMVQDEFISYKCPHTDRSLVRIEKVRVWNKCGTIKIESREKLSQPFVTDLIKNKLSRFFKFIEDASRIYFCKPDQERWANQHVLESLEPSFLCGGGLVIDKDYDLTNPYNYDKHQSIFTILYRCKCLPNHYSIGRVSDYFVDCGYRKHTLVGDFKEGEENMQENICKYKIYLTDEEEKMIEVCYSLDNRVEKYHIKSNCTCCEKCKDQRYRMKHGFMYKRPTRCEEGTSIYSYDNYFFVNYQDFVKYRSYYGLKYVDGQKKIKSARKI